jgi:hypothetical protein
LESRPKLSILQPTKSKILNNYTAGVIQNNPYRASELSVNEMMMQYLSNPELAKGFARVVFDMLKGAKFKFLLGC